MFVLATAYCPTGDLTYTGTVPHYGTIAVDPKVIPLQSIVIIKGQRFRAEDTGAYINGRHIDIFMSDCKEATRYGVRHHRVKVIVKR